MGFTDEQFDAAKGAGVSATQLYKQAGNSIVVPVLMAIFESMNLKRKDQDMEQEIKDCAPASVKCEDCQNEAFCDAVAAGEDPTE